MIEHSTNLPLTDGDALSAELYEQLRAIAHVRMTRERAGHTLQTTALVHEALLRMTQNGRITASARPQFFCAAAESMRRILIDHARANGREKRGGKRRRVSLDDLDPAGKAEAPLDILALDDAICRLESQVPDAAAVVRLRFYAGLSVDETAEALNLSARSVDRLWVYARARLWRALNDEDACSE